MSDITIIPIKEEYTVVTEEGGMVVISTNSVLQTGGTVDLTNYYTKGETDGLLATKADVAHVHIVADITDFSTTVLNGGVF